MKVLFIPCVLFFSLLACQKTQAPPFSPESLGPEQDRKLGVALWTFHPASFEEALALADSSGLPFIEPYSFHRVGGDGGDTLIQDLSPAGIRRLREEMDRHGLRAPSVYITGDTSVRSWKRQFELAQALGATYVTAEPPLSLWDEVDSLAGLFGMKVALHNHWRGVSPYWHPDSVLAAIEGHPHFGACADLGHWPKSGIDPLDGVKTLSGHIIGIHLKDIAAYNDPTLKDVPVGTGIIDFSAIFTELERQGFKGHVYIERDTRSLPNNLEVVRQTIEYFNQLPRGFNDRPLAR